jgi:sec-independent protein translocase protein TatA
MCLTGIPMARGQHLAEKDKGTMGLFDSPTHLLIILAVLVVLFGSAKLPKAAKSMGEAMRIFKKESAKMREEDTPEAQVQASAAPQQVAAPQPQVNPQTATQEQMAALKQQMDALQQQQMAAPQPATAPGTPGTPAGPPLPETQHTNQPG